MAGPAPPGQIPGFRAREGSRGCQTLAGWHKPTGAVRALSPGERHLLQLATLTHSARGWLPPRPRHHGWTTPWTGSEAGGQPERKRKASSLALPRQHRRDAAQPPHWQRQLSVTSGGPYPRFLPGSASRDAAPRGTSSRPRVPVDRLPPPPSAGGDSHAPQLRCGRQWPGRKTHPAKHPPRGHRRARGSTRGRKGRAARPCRACPASTRWHKH
mmetsp:Transcript_43100/g.100433  ORF Transcript_43100/g.100433 Transcript_43100/m.100433 type:complete len:213 (-) Transcript_43100:408-1046(-)